MANKNRKKTNNMAIYTCTINDFYLQAVKHNRWSKHTEYYLLTNWNLFFPAYMCHHNTFLIHQSLENPTEKRFQIVTHFSFLFSLLIMLLIGVLGYVTFTGYTQGNYATAFSLLYHYQEIRKFSMLGFIFLHFELCFIYKIYPINYAVHLLSKIIKIVHGEFVSDWYILG